MSDVTRFNGKLIGKNGEAKITFSANFSESGELLIAVDDIHFKKDLIFLINDHSGKESIYYRIVGVSDDKKRFHTYSFLVSRCSSHLFCILGGKIKLGGSCSSAKIVVPVAEARPAPALSLLLKGIESSDVLSKQTPLGTVEMSGATKPDDHDQVLGKILIRADNIDEMTVVDWKKKADALADHVRRVMSFGCGIILRTPATHFWYQKTMTIYYRSQTEQGKPTMPLIQPLHLGDIFKVAVTSFFSPPIAINNLFFAIEWFAMESTYNEVRLINAMTALENLISSNIVDAKFLEDKEFDKLRKSIRATIKEWLKGNSYTSKECEALTARMNEKLADVNRQSLLDKLQALIQQWGVPMDGIRESDIANAKRARDLIVHQGQYIQKGGSDEFQLWHHFCVVREIIVRVVMTAIGFTGSYQSLLGGFHLVEFPPKPNSTEFASAGS